jgi:hypothetical protein
MQRTLVIPLAFAALVAAAGCASLLGVPDPSLEWCQQPGNQHDFCEDFDHTNAFGNWPASPMPPPGTSRGLAPGKSLPYALDTVVDALPDGASAYTGLETFFSQPFNDVKVNVDIRVAQISFTTTPPITGAGFLLLADSNVMANQPSLCIGLGFAPSGVSATVDLALFLVPNSTNCVTVNNLPAADAGTTAADDDAGASDDDAALPINPTPYIVGEIYLESWTHIALEVQRNNDGSGAITFAAIPNQGGGVTVPTLPPNSLGAGVPELGIATDVTGPSVGPWEVQFDNVTVDFGN